VVGRAAVRYYWNRQFAAISSHVQPLLFIREPDGSITVDVHQVVRDAHSGELLLDSCVRHRYKLKDGLVARMDVLESDLPHSRSGSAGGAATLWSDEPVRIVPYDPDWPARFGSGDFTG
jgi:hypothetical protein